MPRYLLSAGFTLALVPLLFACADIPYRWAKEGTGPNDLVAARNSCLQVVERDYSEFEDYCSPVGRGCTVSERMMGQAIRRHEIFDGCMREQGFRRVPAAAAPGGS